MRRRFRDGHRRFTPGDAATPEVVDLYVRGAAVAGVIGLVAGLVWIATLLLSA